MILACPTCDSRYDVTGHAIGQQFRCRCGTVTALQAPSTQAGQLACPHCGAGVAPQANRCTHCNHALLVKACPRCTSRVFHGHKHCPECGVELGVSATPTTEPRVDRPCPRCTTHLAPRLVGDIVIDECPSCLGIFLDHVAIKRVIEDRAQARAEALVGALPSAAVAPAPTGGKLYVKCPTCATIMNRRQFASGAGIVVDVCKNHGTFFDVGELPRIIQFVMQGGLEKSQRADLDRLREQARRDTQAAQAAKQSVRAYDSSGFGAAASVEAGGALVDLLFALWD